jgi:hypothetical protein
MGMQILNGNQIPLSLQANLIAANLASSKPQPKPTSLNSNIISRIHNIKPGCGGCGRG